MNTLYFITAIASEGPTALEVHLSADGASGTFMFLEDAYRAYDMMNMFESIGINPNLMGLDGGGN